MTGMAAVTLTRFRSLPWRPTVAIGAAGLAAIGKAGGLTVVQDPADAERPTMPAAAICLRAPSLTLPLRDIRALLATLETM